MGEGQGTNEVRKVSFFASISPAQVWFQNSWKKVHFAYTDVDVVDPLIGRCIRLNRNWHRQRSRTMKGFITQYVELC